MIHSDLTEKKLKEVKKTLDIDSMVIITTYLNNFAWVHDGIHQLIYVNVFERYNSEQDVDFIESQMSKGIGFQKMGKLSEYSIPMPIILQ